MRRQFLLASVGALAITGSAFAAEPLPPPPPPVPIFTWTGLYAGIQVGYAWDEDAVTVSSVAPGPPPFLAVSSFTVSPSGFIGGAHLGYNKQIDQWLLGLNWVIGLEGTVDGTTVNTTRDSFFFASALGTPTGPFGFSLNPRSDVQGSARLRLGIAFDRVLLYATGGAAFAGIETDYQTAVPVFLRESDSKTRTGWTVGGGIEYAVTNNWSIRAEYRYSDFGHTIDYPFATLISPFEIFSVQHHLTQNQVQFGISYRFVTMAPVPVVAKY
jgi:outer membrane immunogenic protein